MLRDSSKIWANPSGTSAAMLARGAIGATAFGAFFNPLLAAQVAGGMGAANLGARLLTNPVAVRWLAQSTEIPAHRASAHLQRLATNIRLAGDGQQQQDVLDYLQLLRGEQ
jgi:hypothetical protein